MNQGQKMFYDFYMNLVEEGNEKEAEEVLKECFQKQEEGTFHREYLESIQSKMYELIRPEGLEQLKKAMEQFASKL